MDGGGSMAEKRMPIRRKKRLKIRFGVQYPQRVAFTRDASEEGVNVVTGYPERPGTKLLVELELPSGESVVVYGLVRWAKKVPPNLMRVAGKAGMGVHFTQFTSGKEAYLDYLKSLHR
jgi:hypothetical protein